MNTYQTLHWVGNKLSFWTKHDKFILIQYDKVNMTFLNPHKHKMEYETLIQNLTCNKQKIYIEWAQDNGKYLYYDILTIVKTIQDVTFSLSIFESITPSFDESVSLETVLTSDDLIILSPVRSFQIKYTSMGRYYNHILYLGPFPTKQFIQECHVEYLFNCCSYSNHHDILHLPNVKEILFDVAGWTLGDIHHETNNTNQDNKDEEEKNEELQQKQITTHNTNNNDDASDSTDSSLHSTSDSDDALKSVRNQLLQIGDYLNEIKNQDFNQEKEIQRMDNTDVKDKLNVLDKQIDLIDELLKKGNVLIHCLAGAHRSPFITGCYEYKYGKRNGKTPNEIYKWLISTRDIVQPYFDNWMQQYFAFLEENKQ